jgi:hypothetical protein
LLVPLWVALVSAASVWKSPGRFVEPIPIRGQADHLDGAKPLRRIGSRLAERFQFACAHQNLNVMLVEAEYRAIQPCRQISRRPGCQCRWRRGIVQVASP